MSREEHEFKDIDEMYREYMDSVSKEGETPEGRDWPSDLGLYDEFEGASTGRRSERGGKRSRRTAREERGEKPPRKRKWKKSLAIVLGCFLVLGLCGYFMAKQFVRDKMEQVEHVEVSEGDWDIDPRVKEELKDYKNILLLGVDTRENNGEKDDEGVRSDAIILVTINNKTGDVKLSSILRDSYLDMEEEGYHVIDKITHAHAYGGPVNVAKSINRNLDLNVDDFVRVNWRTVMEVTDLLGGLEVNVEEHELSEMNRILPHTAETLGVEFNYIETTGPQLLDGVQITTYCRIRKTDGDKERSDRMREVISAAVDKAKTLKLSELNNLVNTTMRMITTSMDSDLMTDMVFGMGNYKFGKSDSWPYEYDGAMIDGIWYDVPITLRTNVQEMHLRLFDQQDYQLTERALAINEQVKARSGVYGEEDIDYTLLERYQELFVYNTGEALSYAMRLGE